MLVSNKAFQMHLLTTVTASYNLHNKNKDCENTVCCINSYNSTNANNQAKEISELQHRKIHSTDMFT